MTSRWFADTKTYLLLSIPSKTGGLFLWDRWVKLSSKFQSMPLLHRQKLLFWSKSLKELSLLFGECQLNLVIFAQKETLMNLTFFFSWYFKIPAPDCPKLSFVPSPPGLESLRTSGLKSVNSIFHFCMCLSIYFLSHLSDYVILYIYFLCRWESNWGSPCAPLERIRSNWIHCISFLAIIA